MSRPNTVPAPPSVQEICRGLPISDKAKAKMAGGPPPLVYLEMLLDGKLFRDAFLFVAGWLPLKEAVWWGCVCAWHVERPAPSPAVAATYQAVIRWLNEPTEERRREVEAAMKAAPPRALGTTVAQAVFYSGGSISQPDLPEVLPPPALSRQLLADTVFLAVRLTEPAKMRERLGCCTFASRCRSSMARTAGSVDGVPFFQPGPCGWLPYWDNDQNLPDNSPIGSAGADVEVVPSGVLGENAVNPPPTFEQMCKEFVQFREIMDRSLAKVQESPVKQEARRLAEFMDNKFAEFKQAYPKAMADIDSRLAKVRESAEKVQTDAVALKAKIAEQEQQAAAAAAESATAATAAAAAAAAPTSPAPDLALGLTLREELLDRFGPPKPVEEKGEKSREVWEDWDEWDSKNV